MAVWKLRADPVKWGLMIANQNAITWQIIVARTEADAREIACAHCGDEGVAIWRTDAVVAEVIDPDGPDGEEGSNE